MTDEYIICSAIWYKELHLKNPDVLEKTGYRPINATSGIVFAGWRHANCLYQMVALTGMKTHEAGKSIQGFLTNTNKFVDRKEGAIIALKAKQINKLKYSFDKLYSEDIY